MAGLFQVLWGQSDGTFKKAAVLNGTDDKPLVIPSKGEKFDAEPICTRPFAVDWDHDGDLDLVVGNMTGKFYLFTGKGRGKFAPEAVAIQMDDEPLKIEGQHGDPFVIDWDGDGDIDLLSGSSNGGVQWAENIAGPKKTPVLKAFKALIPVPKEPVYEARPHEVSQPGHSTRVFAADVNGDGKLDLLVGDCISLVSPAKGLSEDDYKKRRAEWEKELEELSKSTEGETDPEKMQPVWDKISKHYKARESFMSEDRTGFVWLYLQE